MDVSSYPVQVLNLVKMYKKNVRLLLISSLVVQQNDGMKEHPLINWGLQNEMIMKRQTDQGSMNLATYNLEKDYDKLFIMTKVCSMFEVPQLAFDKITAKVYKKGDEKAIFFSIHPESLTIETDEWKLVYDEVIKPTDIAVWITPSYSYYIIDDTNHTKIPIPENFHPLFCTDNDCEVNPFTGDLGLYDIVLSSINNIQVGVSNKSRTYIL